MNYLHTSKGRGIASSERLASGGDHISTDGGGHLCTDNSPAAAITSACTPLRKGTRPRLPTGGDNEAIKAKELEVRWQVALTVSPAEATTSAVGSLTSGGDHISPTSGSNHLCTDGRQLPQHARRGPRSRHHCGSEDKTIQERLRRPRGVRRLVRPPGTAGGAGEAVDVADPRTARPSPIRWTDSHAPSKRQEAAPEAAPKPPRPRSQTRGS
jgi:hypothetical protein